jgi:hypothetical protein
MGTLMPGGAVMLARSVANDRGMDVIETVQLLLHPRRTCRAGHALDGELDAGGS